MQWTSVGFLHAKHSLQDSPGLVFYVTWHQILWRRHGACSLDRMIFMATRIPSKPATPPAQTPGRGDGDAVVLERRPQKTAPPQMFQVVMLNDDYTPMEFVVVVIQEFFNKDRETATQIMLKIHLDGRGVCGVYSRDMAATKVNQVMEAAHQAGHPLQCVSEPVE